MAERLPNRDTAVFQVEDPYNREFYIERSKNERPSYAVAPLTPLTPLTPLLRMPLLRHKLLSTVQKRILF